MKIYYKVFVSVTISCQAIVTDTKLYNKSNLTFIIKLRDFKATFQVLKFNTKQLKLKH